MRSLTRGALAAAIALAGCGNYSTEDLRFLAALPQREDLKVEVPSEGTAGALGVCLSGTADVWLWAKPTSDGLNAAVGFLVSLVDAVRRIPPTWRTEDARGWGPFDDERHPGNELRIVIVRRYPPASGGEPVHDYVFQARTKGTLPFFSILGGTFQGGSASRGSGGLVLDFEALWALGMNEADTPHGSMQVLYDRASDPVTIALTQGDAAALNHLREAERRLRVALGYPAPAVAAAPAPAQNTAAAESARSRDTAERREDALAKLADRAQARDASAAAASGLAGRVAVPAAAAPAAPPSAALETPAFSNLRFEIRRKPEAWSWTRDDGAARPVDASVEAWIAQVDRTSRPVWQAGTSGSDPSTTTLRFTRDGVVRAVLRLGPTGMRLTRGGKTESAELSRGQAAALLSSLDALGP